MQAQSLKIDMNDERSRNTLWSALKRWRGIIRIEICAWRKRRTDRQNRFYHPAFVKPFANFLREQGQPYTNRDAHEMLKYKFLRREWVDEKTGEVCAFTGSTRALNTVEFNQYLDLCAAWLHEMFGFTMPDPKDYHERDEPGDNEPTEADPDPDYVF